MKIKLEESLLNSNTQLGKVRLIAKELGCHVYVDLKHGCYYSQDFNNPYISLDSDEIGSMGEAVLMLLHELGHHIEMEITGIAMSSEYESLPEEVICCEILAWIHGIYLAKMLGIPLMRRYREMVKYCLYGYCAYYHENFEKDFKFANRGELNAFKLPHNPKLKEQVDMFLEKL